MTAALRNDAASSANELQSHLARSTLQVSIVVPGLNEGESLPELAQRIHSALSGKETYELIFVDDGSTDNSWAVITQLAQQYPEVIGIKMRANFGKAMALSAGFHAARGEVIVMMDADLQDDPEDLPQFVAKIREGLDVVVGWKVHRKDPLNRRLLSKVFNGTVRRATGVSLHDMNCGFKAFRSEVIRTIPIYGDLFRFIPVLAAARGFRVAEIPVKHHARIHGRSRYGLERILRGFFDLMSVIFLTRYARRPMHLFGLIGLFLATAGVGLNLYLTIAWFLGEPLGKRPLLQLGVLLIVTGIQFGSLGFLGEFMTWQAQMRRYDDELPIRETVGKVGRNS
jgi:glycosyltransferase involved in cell wall biosynthesis